MKLRKYLTVFLSLLLLSGCAGAQESATPALSAGDSDSLAFFKSLDYEDGLKVVTGIFERYPLQYAATLGTDGEPQLRPIEFKFEEDGVLYFDTVVFYSTYAELMQHPAIQLCICDQETMTYLRLGGKVNFTDDKKIIDRCFAESPVLTSQFGEDREVVIAYYLTDVWAEFNSFSEELPRKTYRLTNKHDTAEAE